MKLKTLVAGASLCALSIVPAAPAGAVQAMGVGPGYFASDNVTLVGHVPLGNDGAGGRIVGKYFYVTSSTSLRIYDISDPTNPALVGILPGLDSPYFAEEDVDTNGKILLRNDDVIDVSDKANPKVISSHQGDAHTISCVLDCTYAYASDGDIVDLTDPLNPKMTGTRWITGTPVTSSHDVTEVAPGFVVTSSDPVLLLDARENPAKPKIIAQGPKENRFNHGNLWPHSMTDRWLLVGGESSGATCANSTSARFTTWDTQGWDDPESPHHGKFRLVDTFRLTHGLPTDGLSPANQFCTHWFSTHPDYKNGGYVALAWYEHGTRFLDIDQAGKIKEVGWIMPWGTSASAAYWVTKEIVYVIDYNRGFDILRFTPPAS